MKNLIKVMKEYPEYDFNMYYLKKENNAQGKQGLVINILNREVVSQPVFIGEKTDGLKPENISKTVNDVFKELCKRGREYEKEMKKKEKNKIIQPKKKIIN